MWLSLGFNACLVPMQFHLIKNPGGASHAQQCVTSALALPHAEFHGAVYPPRRSPPNPQPGTPLIASALICVNAVETHRCLRHRSVCSGRESPERETTTGTCLRGNVAVHLNLETERNCTLQEGNLIKGAPLQTFAYSAESYAPSKATTFCTEDVDLSIDQGIIGLLLHTMDFYIKD